MKIVFTVADFGAAANLGGPVDLRSVVIDINDANLPPMVRRFLKRRAASKWETCSISLLEEVESPK